MGFGFRTGPMIPVYMLPCTWGFIPMYGARDWERRPSPRILIPLSAQSVWRLDRGIPKEINKEPTPFPYLKCLNFTCRYLLPTVHKHYNYNYLFITVHERHLVQSLRQNLGNPYPLSSQADFGASLFNAPTV